ncbi:hypothetical protein [Actinopolymorpha alba]|uniref:hypothetical protein n=1 Tax=Actinopolymorpha alba TaxID=533267 RepID=UPI00036BAE3E|nr:hypothetical protein [Actinopolymorpha alba]
MTGRRAALLAPAVLLLAVVTALTVAASGGPAFAAPERRVVLVGLSGLRADDLSSTRTPALARMVSEGASGVLVIRSVNERTCPLDAWLSVSAGERAAGPERTAGPERCAAPPRIVPTSTTNGPGPDGTSPSMVQGWARLASAQDSTVYGAELGLLAEALAKAKVCATAVGPGAAVALADARGRVDRYLPGEAEGAGTAFDPGLLTACPLTVVDAGALPAGAGRADALTRADQLVGDLRAAAGPETTVVVAGLSDEPDTTETALRVAMMAGPGIVERGQLTATSTRRDGLVQLTDLTPTVTALLGVPDARGIAGVPWTSTAGRADDLAGTLARLTSSTTVNDVVRASSVWVFAGLVGVQVLGYAVGLLTLALTRRAAIRRVAGRVASGVALLAGALPCAAFLTSLVPWALSPAPVWSLGFALGGLTVLIAFLAARMPYDPPWAAPTTIALATSAVLAVDVVTGSHLQGGNLVTPGDLPIVGGRYFGFGNVAFSIFAASALLAAGGLAARSAERWHRRTTGLIVLGIGAAAVLIDGWPTWGADFGGVLALVPGVAVLVAGVTGIRLTVRRILLVGVAAVVAVSAVAVADWLRPAEQRSHLGTFVQRVIDGEAVPVIVRKAEAALSTVTYGGPLGWSCIVVYVAAILVVLRPRRFRADALAEAYHRWPTLAPTLRAILVTGVVGFAANDSGLAVPAAILMTAAPLVVVAVIRSAPGSSPARPGSSPVRKAAALTAAPAQSAGVGQPAASG